MKIYYTGASAHLASQTNPLKSLGGFVSSTEVINDGLDTLFSAISSNMMLKGSKESRLIALLNNSGASVTVSVYYRNPSAEPISFLRMALIQPTLNNCSNPYFDKLTDDSSQAQGFFVDNRGEDNQLQFSLAANSYIGLWIERRISKNKSLELLDCDYMYDKYQKVNKVQSSIITLNSVPAGNSYFFLYTQQGSYCVWYKRDGVTPTIPTIAGYENITIPITATPTLQDVITSTQSQLNDILYERGEIELVDATSSTLTITQTAFGVVATPTIGSIGFPMTVVNDIGFSTENELIESLDVIISY